MPLRALIDGQNFFADKLTESNRKDIFQCPNCPSRLIPVLPTQNRIKHFRHVTGKAHYEPETLEHLTGKQVLLEIASKLGLNVISEYRIGEHVTDVFIDGNQPLAIEFQCSKCNSKEISERNRTYIENGVAPFWILGANFLRGKSERKTKIEKEIEKSQRLVYYMESKFRQLVRSIFYDYNVIRFLADCGISFDGKTCTITPRAEAILNSKDKKIFGEHKKISGSFFGNSKLTSYEDFNIEWHMRSFTENKLTIDKPSLTFALERWERPFFTF